jgi:hypothetical protein
MNCGTHRDSLVNLLRTLSTTQESPAFRYGECQENKKYEKEFPENRITDEEAEEYKKEAIDEYNEQLVLVSQLTQCLNEVKNWSACLH